MVDHAHVRCVARTERLVGLHPQRRRVIVPVIRKWSAGACGHRIDIQLAVESERDPAVPVAADDEAGVGTAFEVIVVVDRRLDGVRIDDQRLRLLGCKRDVVVDVRGARKLAHRFHSLVDHVAAAIEDHLFGFVGIELHQHTFAVRPLDIGAEEFRCGLVQDRRHEACVDAVPTAVDQVLECVIDRTVGIGTGQDRPT